MDTSKVFVHAGLGFHVEFTLGEAIPFINKRVDFLQCQANDLARQMHRIKANITLMEEALSQYYLVTPDSINST